MTSQDRAELPRLVIAGLAGDTGKSLVSLGLVRCLKQRSFSVAPFKKGPDFIDAAWLGAAAGDQGRNLDSFMMSSRAIKDSLAKAVPADIAVIEGNRGLFDGLDAEGSHSTAQLAKMIDAPVVLVVGTSKVTRTVAAQVLGCCQLDPDLRIAGVILNRVATARQEKVIRQAVQSATGVPVLGAIPRLDVELPSRHLGLVTAVEHRDAESVLQSAAAAIERYVDVDAVQKVAATAGPLAAVSEQPLSIATASVRIGVLRDRAFSFYYPENLEALRQAGAEIVEISPLADSVLPDIDALYAGGGFPEVYVAELAANDPLKRDIKKQISQGLPVWAECGGLMYLSRALVAEGVAHPMVGALPIVVEQQKKPQGHGYVKASVDGRNPFLPQGTELLGHEFHYSRLQQPPADLSTVLRVTRGVGVGEGRDGISAGCVIATYTHLHALGTPAWAAGMVRAAQQGGAA